jgi:lipopolysaccharide transport system ATP-binding protein
VQSMHLAGRIGPAIRPWAHFARAPIAALVVRRDHDDQVCVDVNSRDDGVTLGVLTDATISLELDRLDLAPGRYWLDVGLYRADWEVVFDYRWHAVGLVIGDRPTSTRGQLYPPRRWALKSGAASR